MHFSVGDIVMFLILLGVSLFSIVKYCKLKKQKYILFLLICIHGLFNKNNMIYITRIEINNTIYIEVFRFIILILIITFGYNLYKKKELF